MSQPKDFNNLTKSLRFNLYDFAIALNDQERLTYVRYIEARYSSAKLESILLKVAEAIDAKVVNLSSKDFDPYGSSVVMLMEDEGAKPNQILPPISTINIHLDKSHICAHTYPDCLDPKGICSFRVDIDIATCGSLSPLVSLNLLFNSFESDCIHVDYAVRGFTRAADGSKIFMDHPCQSITQYLDRRLLGELDWTESNSPETRTFQARFRKKRLDPLIYFRDPNNVEETIKKSKMNLIEQEIDSVFSLRF